MAMAPDRDIEVKHEAYMMFPSSFQSGRLG